MLATSSMRTLSGRPCSRRPLASTSLRSRRTSSSVVAPRADYRPRGDGGGGDKGEKKDKDEIKTAAADPRPRRSVSPTRETEEDDDEPEEVSLASAYASAGIGLMINAAGFAAVYRVSPSLKILAGLIEERQDPALFAFFAKVGTILASPADIFLLTVCLLLIEFMKWLNDE